MASSNPFLPAQAGGGGSSSNPFAGATFGKPAAAAPKDKKPSVVSQIRDHVSGAVTALPHLAQMAGIEARNLVYDPDNPGPISSAIIGQQDAQARRDRAKAAAPPPAPDAWGRVKQRLEHNAPFSASIVESNQRTGGDILHPSRLAQASRDGTLVSKIIEDVANISAVAGPTLHAATGGSLATKAAEGSTLAKVFVKGADVAEHPFIEATKGAGKLAGKAVTTPFGAQEASLGARLLDSEGHLGALARSAKDRAEVLPIRREVPRRLEMEGTAKRTELIHPLGEAAKAVKGPVEGEAVILHVQGLDRASSPIVSLYRRGVIDHPEFVQRIEALHDPKAPSGHVITPEGAAMAFDYRRGKAPAEVAARLDKGVESFRKATVADAANERAGYGRSDGQPLDPAQFGNEAVPAVVEQKTARMTARVAKNEATLAEREAALGAHTEKAMNTEVRQATGLLSEAADLRGVSRSMKADRALVAEQAPYSRGIASLDRKIAQTDLKASLKEQRAKRLVTTKAVLTDDGKVTVARLRRSEALTARDRAAEQLARSVTRTTKAKEVARLSPDAAPARFRPVIDAARRSYGELQDLHDKAPVEARPVIRKMMDDLPTDIDRINKAGLGDEIAHVIQGLATEGIGGKKVYAYGHAPKVGKLTSEHVRQGTIGPKTIGGVAKLYDQKVRKAVGNVVAKDLAEAHGRTAADFGLDHLKGAKLVEEMRKQGYAPYQLVAGASGFEGVAGSRTTFLPTSIAREFHGWSGAPWKWDEFLRHTYDPVMGVFKTGVLALSPRWHLGNLVSNAILTGVSAGVHPSEMVRYWKEGRALWDKEAGEFTGRLATPEAHAVRGGGMTNEVSDVLRQGTRKEVGRVRQFGRDQVQRSYAANRFIDDMGRNIAYLRNLDKGLSPEVAMKGALRTMGDFGQMTAMERAVGRRVLPFYAWTKAITKISAALAYDHPGRVAWTLHLGGNLGGGADQQAALPDWAKGSIALGHDKMLRLAFLNPFGDVTEPVFTPKGFLKGVSPVLKEGSAVLGNRDVQKLGPLTAPAGTDDGIHPIGWKPAAGRLLGVLPQTRALRDAPGDQIVRYGNTEPVLRSGRTIDAAPPGGRLGQLAQAANIPWPGYSQTEADRARAAKTQATKAKSRATYSKKRAAAARKPPVKR